MKTYTITQLTNSVKSFLRTVEKKIAVGNTASTPVAGEANTGSVAISSITLTNDYHGRANYEIRYAGTNKDVFTVWKSAPDGPTQISGIASSTAWTGGYITITFANITGTPVSGDKILFSTNTDISETDFSNFLIEYCEFVKSRLSSVYAFTYPTDETGVSMDGTLIQIIKHGVAYQIYTSIFAGNIQADVSETIKLWRETAEELINKILSGSIIPETSGTSTNVNLGRDILITETDALFGHIGIPEINEVDLT